MYSLAPKVALGAVLVAALVACGGAGGGGSSTPNAPSGPGSAAPRTVGVTATPIAGEPADFIDACTLLTNAELKAATGSDVLSQEASTLTQVFPSVCDIELADAGSLTISIMATGGRAMYETSFEPLIGDDSNVLDRAVTGLGDKAAMQGDETIMVLKDDVLFDIFFIGFGRSDKEQVIRYLAEVILAKLPCIATGCAGYTPPPAPSAPPVADVCALLTTEEIESTTGAKANTGSASVGFDGTPLCSWTLDSGVLDHVEVSLMETGGAEQFNFYANDYFETPPEHISGLGDDAIKSGTIPGGSIWVVKGDELLTLRFSLPLSVEDPYAVVLPLAETAVSRM